MKNRVLIAEDEKPISDIIKFNLEKEGYEIITAYDGEDALKKALNEQLELIILDIMLPSMDGFEICKRVREKSSVPIIMVTAKEEEVDKILGLELGADDYITKPFSIRELVARVKANVRRHEMNINADQQEKEIIKNKDLSKIKSFDSILNSASSFNNLLSLKLVLLINPVESVLNRSPKLFFNFTILSEFSYMNFQVI